MNGYDAAAHQRWAAEPPKAPRRSDFERDRARVLHSAALRRLAAKTQVVAPGSDDFTRNRLTHSLEVAQVGRELGRALGCAPDVVDAACLAHDLGHPPFGHNGEIALNDAAVPIGGFEGNAQTLRLLSRLEAKVIHPDGRPAGLNLTRASLDAATKYPWPRSPDPRISERSVKFGVYAEDSAVFDWLRAGAPQNRRCLEAQVMDFADDVAYSVHDVEDAVVAGFIDLGGGLADAGVRRRLAEVVQSWALPDAAEDEVVEALDRLRALPRWVSHYDGTRTTLAGLKDMTSQLIGRFCDTAEHATHEVYGHGPLARYQADLVVPREIAVEVATLKGLAVLYVMTTDHRTSLQARQRELLGELVDALLKHGPHGLEAAFRQDWFAAADDDARLRVVIDQVASLTDVSAYAWHAKLR